MIPWLLAHQGGWDELLIFAVPALGAILGLRWAEKRAKRRAQNEQDAREQSRPDG